MKLPGSDEMRAIDRSAIEEFGIPGVVLMENAGSGTVRLIEKYFNPTKGSFAPVSYTHLRAHETSRAISYAVFCL